MSYLNTAGFELEWPRGQVDHLRARISLTDDLEQAVQIADDLPVSFTFDRETFHDGEWIGDVDSTRVCRVLVDDDMLPDYPMVEVFVRLTDNPEIPYIPVGTLNII